MRQICEGVAATYDGQRMVKGQLVIYEDHCVFTGTGVSREFHWGALQQLDARRVDVTVPNTQGQRQQPALRMSNGETAQLWMMTTEMAETMLRSIAQEKEIDRCVVERIAAVNAEYEQMREQLARKDETIRQTSVRIQLLEERLRAYEEQEAEDEERTLTLMTELEVAQRRVAELTQRVAELTAGQAAAEADAAETPAPVKAESEPAAAFVPAEEPAPAAAEFVPSEESAAAEFVPSEEPAPAAEAVPEAAGEPLAGDAVSPDDLMHMFQAEQAEQACEPLLVTTLQTKLAGTTDCNADGSNRQRIIRDMCRRNRMREEQELLLEYTPRECAVLVPGEYPEQIGCLSAEDAALVARAVDARVFVAEVSGGANGGMIAVTVKLQLYMSVHDAEHTLPRLGEGDGSARPAPAEAPRSAPEKAATMQRESPAEIPGGAMKSSYDGDWQQDGHRTARQQPPFPGAADTPVQRPSDPFGLNKDKMKF